MNVRVPSTIKIVTAMNAANARSCTAVARRSLINYYQNKRPRVVNRRRSQGALAPTALLNEPPDGHTLLVGNSSPLVAAPLLRRDAPVRLGPRAFLKEQFQVWGTVARQAWLQAR
jgi:hypothetical protein